MGKYFPAAACQVALLNGGSLRASIPQGNISFVTVNTALPFTDTVTSLQLQGSDLVAVLQQSLNVFGAVNQGPFLQIRGIRVTYNPNNPVGLRLMSAMIADPSTPSGYSDVKASTYYTVCTNSWLQTGGDGYTTIAQQAIGVFPYVITVRQGAPSVYYFPIV